MKVLVTGSAGFIGYHLSKSLLEIGYEVLGVDNINEYYDKKIKEDRLNLLKSFDNYNFHKLDISNIDSLQPVFESYDPERVVNLAAQPGVRYSLINPYEYINSNILGFLNIIELCKNNHSDGLIYASSSSVYGSNDKIPFSTSDKVDNPQSLYGVSKRTNELIARVYSDTWGLNTTGLRYFTAYGPWYRPDMAIFIFIKKIIAREPIDLFNQGDLYRDFTYIDDIIEGTLCAIDKNYQCEIFNLGNNRDEKITKIISIIEDSLGIKAIIDNKPMQPGDSFKTCADIKYSEEKILYKPQTAIEKGIPKVIRWYRDYYNV